MLNQIIEALTKKEPLTAEQLAAAIKCTVPEFLAALREEREVWWQVEQVASSAGWVYQLRKIEKGVVPRMFRSAWAMAV